MGISRRRGRTTSFDDVAGNGLINRRALLGQGIALAGAAGISGTTGAAAEPLKDEAWSLAFGEITPPLQTPSRFEKDVVRALSNPKSEFRNSHARTPHHLLNGTITPNALHFSINHAGMPDIDPAKHKLVIHGMVKQPLEFTLETLSRYPLVTRTALRRMRRQLGADVLQRAAAGDRPACCTGWCRTRNGPACRSRRCSTRRASIRRQVAGRGGRRRPFPRPQHSGQEGLRRRAGRDLPERRAADAGQRLSDAPPAARLSGQHERQVPAPHQGGRPAGHDATSRPRTIRRSCRAARRGGSTSSWR